MKRLLLVILALVSMAFMSCSKSDTLAGTKWLGTEGGSTMGLSFTASEFSFTVINENKGGYYVNGFSRITIYNGSYVYEAPSITFIATEVIDGRGNVSKVEWSFTGVVAGKVLTIDAPVSANLIKQ